MLHSRYNRRENKLRRQRFRKSSAVRSLSWKKAFNWTRRRNFSTYSLISFERDKNIGNFVVRSVLESDVQPSAFKCAHKRCNTCPFIHDADKVTGPKRSIEITDRFTCASESVIYSITGTECKKIYKGGGGGAGRRLGDRFREHLQDVERNGKAAYKQVARHFNIPNHSSQPMPICGLSLHQGNTESRKHLKQKFIFKSVHLIPTVSTNAFHSTNLFLFFTL